MRGESTLARIVSVEEEQNACTNLNCKRVEKQIVEKTKDDFAVFVNLQRIYKTCITTITFLFKLLQNISTRSIYTRSIYLGFTTQRKNNFKVEGYCIL